ncbi:MAG TPA: putative metal-binding motif-containing protein, partial [Polyangiaceae bacterium]
EDPELGGPCVDDLQCDDEIDCTEDHCDLELARCRHVPSDAVCDDGVYCNGVEECTRLFGCRAGEVVSCTDLITCSIDTCIEETQSCTHEFRDADGDGDPTFDCTGGDCDDNDPYISSETSERCGNQRDDDCDGEVDESECVRPMHDRCSDALEVDTTGTYEVSLQGTALDYAVSCEKDVGEGPFRDLVIAVVVPEGETRDVSVVAMVPRQVTDPADGKSVPVDLVLAASEQCGSAAEESACVVGVDPEDDDVEARVARLYLHGLSEGAHTVYLAATAEVGAIVWVDFRDPTAAPENETCATAAPLEPDQPVRAVLSDVTKDIESDCPEVTGDLVYRFELTEASDVRISAVSLDGYGTPVVSLRSEACAEIDSELTCRTGSPRELFARALPAGSYRVGLAGTGPTEAEIALSLSPPTEALPGEGCEGAPVLEFGETEQVTLSDRPDAVQIGCVVGAPDASFSLELEELSDVLLLERSSSDSQTGVLLATGSCAAPEDQLSCNVGGGVRAVARGVGPGTLRAVVENGEGKPVSVAAFQRPAQSPVFVPRADECEDALRIPEAGGRFEGTTRNAFADYDASCDYGGAAPGGANDQMLKLVLDQPRRMVFDMAESSYDTLLVVRDASDGCPGSEVAGACASGYVSGRSFLDIDLAAGEYWVQIDGYDGESGRWVLEVFGSELR